MTIVENPSAFAKEKSSGKVNNRTAKDLLSQKLARQL
jgi:hypothetical protein